MTRPAAFQGSYADLRFIRTRKVAAITVEIPIEMASAFIDAFGAPDPSAEIPVAIARLDLSQKQEPEPKAIAGPEKRSWEDIKPAAQAGIRCNEVAFQRFLREEWPARWERISFDDSLDNDEKRAAAFVRDYCDVSSRADLQKNHAAAAKWQQLERIFSRWMGRA